jgi:hypothetical protein
MTMVGKSFFVVMAISASAYAQTPVQTGTTFAFDHDAESALDTARYELCVDTVSDATCSTIGVVRQGLTNEYRFTLPSTVSRGNRALAVRAVGLLATGTSGPSNTVLTRIIGKPNAPTTLRTVEP